MDPKSIVPGKHAVPGSMAHSNHLIHLDEDARSRHFMDIPARSQVPQRTAASDSNLSDLFGLGALRRDTINLANLDTFSIGDKGPSTSGKRKTKTTVAKVEGPWSRLSSVSSASFCSEPMDEFYDAPWRKEMYDDLASLTIRHTELIEQQISHNITNHRLTRDIDQVGGHVRQMLTSQRSTEERLSTYDTLLKK